MEPTRPERLDDLYIPFEKSSARIASTVSRPLGRSTNGIALPWGLTNPPESPTISGHQMFRRSEEENLKRFEPDIELRDESYILEGDFRPAVSQILLGLDDMGIADPRIGSLAVRSPPTYGNQASVAMHLTSQDRDGVREALPGGQSMATGNPSFQGLKSQVRRRKESEQLPNISSYKGSHSSKQSISTKTTSHHSPMLRKREPWQIQKLALLEKFGRRGWSPRKRLSPDALEGIRALHAQYPDKFTTPVLADQFKVSPEAIRRILRSKWQPDAEEEISRLQRWDKRGELIWGQMVELGVKPPKRWREMGIAKREDEHRSGPRTKGPRGASLRGLDWVPCPRDYQPERSTNTAMVVVEKDEESLAERIL